MMNDPMAGMDQEPNVNANADGVDSKEVFDPMILQFNLQRIERIRSVMGIASGCIAGIAGLTGWEGISKWLGAGAIICMERLGLTTSTLCLDHIAPFNFSHAQVTSSLLRSSLLGASCVCESNDLGLENEFQTESLHTTILV